MKTRESVRAGKIACNQHSLALAFNDATFDGSMAPPRFLPRPSLQFLVGGPSECTGSYITYPPIPLQLCTSSRQTRRIGPTHVQDHDYPTPSDDPYPHGSLSTSLLSTIISSFTPVFTYRLSPNPPHPVTTRPSKPLSVVWGRGQSWHG
eukprot:760128-Hanusia_phi.AAC.2